MKNIAIYICLMNFLTVQAEVLIFTYSYNRPDFIEVQYKTFQKFLKDDHKFVVFNDGRTNKMAQSIKQVCQTLGIECIRIPQHIHDQPYLKRLAGESLHAPAVRNCNVVMYSLNEYGFAHNDILMLVDSDLFLTKELSVRSYLEGYDLAGLPQGIGYLWIGLVILNIPQLPNVRTLNFNCGKVNNVAVDAGGYSYHYVRDNPHLRVKYFAQCYPHHFAAYELATKCNFDSAAIRFIRSNPHNIEYMLDNCFLHYRGGTNWDGKSAEYHKQKTKILNDYIDNLLAM